MLNIDGIQIGERLRIVREDREYSVNALARLADISASYISDLENGKKANPSIKELVKICKSLNIGLDVLLDAGRFSQFKNKSALVIPNSLVPFLENGTITLRQAKKILEMFPAETEIAARSGSVEARSSNSWENIIKVLKEEGVLDD